MEEHAPFKCIFCAKEAPQDAYSVFSYCPFCGKNQVDINEPYLKNGAEKQVYSWLSDKFDYSNELLSKTFKNEMATVFLFIWPIIELKLFHGVMSHSNIKEISYKCKNLIQDSKLDSVARHFFNRYKNDIKKYNELVNPKTPSDQQQDHDWIKVRRLLSNSYDKLSKFEKLIFMIFVVYRYRNNIFHGTKSLHEWNNYSTEIQSCIEFMIMIGNCIEKENIYDSRIFTE